jgi:outer membrane protein OmpA-like peptidoglycan-associated protein
VKLSEKNGVLRAEGAAPSKWIAHFEERAPWIAGVNSIDVSRLQNSDRVAFDRLKSALESVVLVFPLGRTELEPGQEAALAQEEKDLQGLLVEAEHLGGTVAIEIVGHTDSTGMEASNLPLSRQRAHQIFNVLRRAGVKSTNLLPRGVATSEPIRAEDTEEGRRYNRSVTFKVAFSPAPPVH